MSTLPKNDERKISDSEKEEREVGTFEITESPTCEKSTADEVEKLKKPTIGASLVILLIINSIQFFVGITTTKDCPAKSIIPIYLAVAGAVGVITKVMPIVNRNKRLKVIDIILSLLVIFEFIWMILGSIWIYSIYEPNYDIFLDSTNYCNKTAYLLAFWLLTLHYIFLILIVAALLIVFVCCVCLCAACMGKVLG